LTSGNHSATGREQTRSRLFTNAKLETVAPPMAVAPAPEARNFLAHILIGEPA